MLSVLSTPTPPISLNDQPGGSFAQFSTGSYAYAPLPTVAMPGLPCSLPVGKLVTKQMARPAKSSQAKYGYGAAVVLFRRPANSSRPIKAYSAGAALVRRLGIII